MRKRMLLFVGGPLNASKADMEGLGRFLKDKDIAVDVVWFHDTHRIRNEVKKERLEAFVAAVNNNHHPSHIAYLEDGCDVCQVITESGILTRVKKDVSGLAPGLLMEEERATHKNKAAVIDSPENVIPYGMRMKNHPQTSTRGLAPALADLSMEDKRARIKAAFTGNVIPNNNKKKKMNKKMNKLLDNSEPEKTPFKTSKNDNMSRKGKNQVAKMMMA
ncbi:26S proteasome non-ATPase regulatory subunit 4 [Tanacetum coccineum]